MPHPFQHIEVTHSFWKEEHQPGSWGSQRSSPLPGFVLCLAASTVTIVGPGPPLQLRLAVIDDHLPTKTIAAMLLPPAVRGSQRLGYLQVCSLLCPWTFVCLGPHLSACLLISSRVQLRTSAALSPASAPSIAVCGCAKTTPSRVCARTTKTASTV